MKLPCLSPSNFLCMQGFKFPNRRCLVNASTKCWSLDMNYPNWRQSDFLYCLIFCVFLSSLLQNGSVLWFETNGCIFINYLNSLLICSFMVGTESLIVQTESFTIDTVSSTSDILFNMDLLQLFLMSPILIPQIF